jgi:3-phenylpropionate/trans-cinnamate dioxygenase ferredoxin reductase component
VSICTPARTSAGATSKERLVSDSDASFVIVGAGLAGGNAAASLREDGFSGRVVLIGREPGIPFGRPPLSKTYLRSEEGLDGWYVKPPGWYEEHDIERLEGASVVEIDAAGRSLTLDSGEALAYERLLVATGGQNRRLDVPGAELEGIHYLRTLAECEAIKREARAGLHAVVVGMGFIGCEIAASLTQLGVRVTTVFPGRAPLERALGPEVADAIGAIHRHNGVELLAGHQLTGFQGSERVRAAVTADGGSLSCDFVVVGAGIKPEAPPFVGASVATHNGVLVDERCRASDPSVYAAGDVANQLHPLFGRVRVEHYNNAEKQGRAAARSMLGDDAPYDYVHTFWSDQYEHKLEYAGHATDWERFVVRGSLEERRFIGFYLSKGLLRAAVGLDRGGDPELDEDEEMAACARLVARSARPDPAQLADERVDLWSLVP